jgi:hypothetical protein
MFPKGDKHWYESKTVWAQILTMAMGVCVIVAGSELVSVQVSLAFSTIVIPIINLFLRWITDSSITSPIKALDKSAFRKDIL